MNQREIIRHISHITYVYVATLTMHVHFIISVIIFNNIRRSDRSLSVIYLDVTLYSFVSIQSQYKTYQTRVSHAAIFVINNSALVLINR